MKNNGQFMTRKQQQRQEFEDHFYATWPATLDKMTYEELEHFNTSKLEGINAGYPDTMLWLKHQTLLRIANFERSNEK